MTKRTKLTSKLNGPSQRQLRVGEQLRHIIVETMRRGHFYSQVLIDHAASITVSEVRATPDLKQATAYVLSLGGVEMDEILPALNENATIFQKAIGANGNLKFTPRVRFKEDISFEKVQKLDALLSNITYSDQDQE